MCCDRNSIIEGKWLYKKRTIYWWEPYRPTKQTKRRQIWMSIIQIHLYSIDKHWIHTHTYPYIFYFMVRIYANRVAIKHRNAKIKMGFWLICSVWYMYLSVFLFIECWIKCLMTVGFKLSILDYFYDQPNGKCQQSIISPKQIN